ncbi:MAG: hypothetical protein LBB45_09475 [Methanobrevibacter sp.]|jgi:hypothetical protein|nr:hypothetical protein [Candidatus Methanovirga basalitermitum]
MIKRYILPIIIIIGVILSSGCITNNQDTKTLSRNGITINYPSNWMVANTQVNETIIAVGNPELIDNSSGLGLVSVNIQKRILQSPLNEYFNQVYKTLFSNSSYRSIGHENVTFSDYKGLEVDYTVTEGNEVKEQKAYWIENNGYVYVILCTAPQKDFPSQKPYFDFILNSFKIN